MFVRTREFSRRSLLFCGLLSLSFAFCAAYSLSCLALESVPASFKGDAVFQKILHKSQKEHWQKLPVGELLGHIARELEGTPYVGGTLDHCVDKEACTIDLSGLDCVTFFETTLDFARMLKKGGKTPADLLKEVQFTRYRGGKLGDYSSRLHYTTDWLVDNQRKGVVKILSELPGAAPFTQKVGFMTEHPELYKQLSAHSELVKKMKGIESDINGRELKFIPLDRLEAVEPLLKTGDIVGICTNKAGLDISHTGLVFRDAKGVPHFMDASSKKSNMKVTIEPDRISKTLGVAKNAIGAMFARPQEPEGDF